MTPELLKSLEHSRSMLYLHGHLSEAENDRVKKRIKKACDKAGLKVKRVSILEGADER